jgi:hypothetical protein
MFNPLAKIQIVPSPIIPSACKRFFDDRSRLANREPKNRVPNF